MSQTYLHSRFNFQSFVDMTELYSKTQRNVRILTKGFYIPLPSICICNSINVQCPRSFLSCTIYYFLIYEYVFSNAVFICCSIIYCSPMFFFSSTKVTFSWLLFFIVPILMPTIRKFLRWLHTFRKLNHKCNMLQREETHYIINYWK